MNEAEITKVVAASSTDSIKEELKKSTDEGVAAGSFGAPTIIVKKLNTKPSYVIGNDILFIIYRMYFGSDRMHLIFDEV